MISGKQALDDLDEEIRDHIERETQDNLARGLSPEAARQAARRKFGSVTLAKEHARAVWVPVWLDQLRQDVGYGVRGLRRNRGFAAVAVITIALGIGANTAIFSLIDALMLRWLPVRNPQDLVQVWMYIPESKGHPGGSFSYAIVRALADQHEIFAGVAGYSGYSFVAGSGETLGKVQGALVTGGYYDALGLIPAMGRLLTPRDG